MLCAQFSDFIQVTWIWNNNSSFSLDRLKKYGCNIFIRFEHFLNSWNVIKWHHGKPRSEWPKLLISGGIIACSRCSDGASPEVAFHDNDLGLVVRNSFFDIAPSASKFHGRLSALSARVHWQEFVITKELGQILTCQTHLVVVEGSWGLCDLSCLLNESLENLRVAMTLIGWGVTAEEIIILTAWDIPHIDTFTSCDCNGKRLVIMSTIFEIKIYIVRVLFAWHYAPTFKPVTVTMWVSCPKSSQGWLNKKCLSLEYLR